MLAVPMIYLIRTSSRARPFEAAMMMLSGGSALSFFCFAAPVGLAALAFAGVAVLARLISERGDSQKPQHQNENTSKILTS
jgi:hypothetical protein